MIECMKSPKKPHYPQTIVQFIGENSENSRRLAKRGGVLFLCGEKIKHAFALNLIADRGHMVALGHGDGAALCKNLSQSAGRAG